MSIENRIARLEDILGRDDEDAPQAVPAAWLQYDPDTGQHVGPPPGAVVTPGQQRVLDQLAAMDNSIPFADGIL